MAKSKASIKSRIKSINTTKKITGAMELIANIKFQKELKLFNANKDYSNDLEQIAQKVINSSVELDSVYLKKNNSGIRYCFVFLSDLGLCGGYNMNLLKLVKESFSDKDELYVIGFNQINYLHKNNLNVINEPISSDQIDYRLLSKLMTSAVYKFNEGKIDSIEIAYTKFINNVSFIPTIDKVLPLKELKKEKEYKEILMEPNASVVFDNLMPLVLANTLYNRYIQSKTTEQASRRFAMENATDNANELIEDLTLAYNQARQGAITQEITEIVSGADAL